MQETTTQIKAVDAVEGRVIYVLILVVFVQSIYPITGDGSVLSQLAYQFFYTLLLFAGVVVSREKPMNVRVLVVLGIAWFVAGTIYAFNQTAVWALYITYLVVAAFQAMVMWVLLEFIFRSNDVNRDVIYAASAVYLLLGAIFVPIYGFIETVEFSQDGTHAFNDGVTEEGEVFAWQTFIYYSYATLTTLGYGDILPVTMWARSAASLQAVIGVLYITVIMARLVGLYASSRREVGD